MEMDRNKVDIDMVHIDDDTSITLPTKIFEEENFIKLPELGSGQFGVVRHYKCPKTHLDVAVKKIRFKLDEDTMKSIDREISVCQKLQHPNIVQYLGKWDTSDSFVCIVMEYVAKGSLRQKLLALKVLPNTQALSDEEIFSHMDDALKGLKYLHKKFVIHRDIRSANMLITAADVLKICDFGLAKPIQNWAKDCSNTTGVGNLFFKAPEMFFGKGVTFSSDVWSLGIMLLHMIQKRPAMMEMDECQYTMRICQQIPPDIPDFASEDVQALLKACLTFDPEKRPTAGELQKRTAKLRPDVDVKIKKRRLSQLDLTDLQMALDEHGAQQAKSLAHAFSFSKIQCKIFNVVKFGGAKHHQIFLRVLSESDKTIEEVSEAMRELEMRKLLRILNSISVGKINFSEIPQQDLTLLEEDLIEDPQARLIKCWIDLAHELDLSHYVETIRATVAEDTTFSAGHYVMRTLVQRRTTIEELIEKLLDMNVRHKRGGPVSATDQLLEIVNEIIAKEKMKEEKRRKRLEEQAMSQPDPACERVVLQLHRGDDATISEENFVSFKKSVTTIAAPRARCGPRCKVYYEVKIVKDAWCCVGWATSGYTYTQRHEHYGDVGWCENSYGYNPHNGDKHHNDKFTGTKWGVKTGTTEHRVLGVAADLVSGKLLYGWDGEWGGGMGIAFDDLHRNITLFPAISGKECELEVNFGQRSFRFQPPDATYVGVQDTGELS